MIFLKISLWKAWNS